MDLKFKKYDDRYDLNIHRDGEIFTVGYIQKSDNKYTLYYQNKEKSFYTLKEAKQVALVMRATERMSEFNEKFKNRGIGSTSTSSTGK